MPGALRLILVRHGETEAVRAAAFPIDEPLVDRGRAASAALVGHLPARADAVRSPARRCAETAAALGHAQAPVDERLRDCDFGDWAGRSLADVHAADPDAVGAWMSDPTAAPHGGESLVAFLARVAGWVDEVAATRTGALLAVTHSGVVRAAVCHALGAPVEALWRVDVAPASLTQVSAHDGRLTVQHVNWRPSRRGGEDDVAAEEAARADAVRAEADAAATRAADPTPAGDDHAP